MNIINQLVIIYDSITAESHFKLKDKEAYDYFERLIMNGNIITYVVNGELLGFIEFWRISYSQFGRICCNQTLAHDEDLINGNVCLITRMYIKPDLRNGETFLHLGRTFLNNNKEATYFAAQQGIKKHKPLQIYTRDEVLRHYKI